MDDRFSGIAVFVQAVESGSFALAADRMNLTRSAVSKIIAKLEQRLGVHLFQRTTRQQKLTQDGHAYYERCVRIMAELNAAEAELDGGRLEPRGQLKVSAPVVFGRHCVTPVLASLADRHPSLVVDIAFNDRVIDLVDEGFDLAIRIGSLPDSASLVARRLGMHWMHICASPSYLAKHGIPHSIEEVAEHACIMLAHSSQGSRWRLFDERGQAHELYPRIRMRLDELQAIADMAAAGMGLACLPTWLISPYVRMGKLAVVMNNLKTQPADIHVVWPQTRHLFSKARVAIDVLINDIPPLLSTSQTQEGVKNAPHFQIIQK